MNLPSKKLYLVCATSVGALLSLAANASAQTAQAQSVPDTGVTTIQDVVVTAQRREQSAQSVPIAISTLSASAVSNLGVDGTTDLTAAIPSLNLTQQNQAVTPYIRGIGNKNTSPGEEAAVALYIDGVYIDNPAANIFALNNIKRIEVLEGPQGTLFGRNATAGVIQIITRDPSQHPSADFTLGYGNYDTTEASFYGTTGVLANLATDLAVYYKNQAEGWGRSLTTGQQIYRERDFGIRNKWVMNLGDKTEVTAAVDYNKSQPATSPVYHAVGAGILKGGYGDAGFYDTYAGVNAACPKCETDFANTEQWGASLKIRQDLGFAQLVSISSYRHVLDDFALDNDATPNVYQDTLFNQYSHTVQQELQVLSPKESRINWIGGFYYYNSDAGYDPLLIQLGPTKIQRYSHQGTVSYAGYGQFTAEIFKDTNLTGGLRYTVDDREIDGHDVDNGVLNPASIVTDKEKDFSRLSYRVALDHKFYQDFLAYASISNSFKSGIFNAVSPTAPYVLPEVLTTYEIGLKTQWLDRRLLINGDIFYNDFSNIQFQAAQPGGVTLLLNAAAARGEGFELTVDAVPIRNLKVGVDFTYLDNTYTSFKNAIFYQPIGLPAGGNTTVIGNATGKQTILSPPESANVHADYTIDTQSGVFDIAGSVGYNSGYYFDAQNRLKQPEYALVNGSIHWTAPSGNWGIRLWGKNLTGEEYYAQIVPQTYGDTGLPAAPRTFGVTADFHLR